MASTDNVITENATAEWARALARGAIGALRYLLRPDRVLYAALAAAALYLCWTGAEQHSLAVNRNFKDKDQGAYLSLAERISQTHAVEVDGARPPLYPALLAAVRTPELARPQFFLVAKHFSIALTLGAWGLTLFVLRRRLRPWTALAVWAVLAFTVFMFYAPYIKGEGLFYSLALCSFISLLDVLARPTLPRALLAGVVAAAAQLVKESMLPALGLFTAVQLLATLALVFRLWRRKRLRPHKRLILSRVLSIPAVLLAFFFVVYPHVSVNKRVFGHYFYNVNSYFYLWYDSWGAVSRGTRGHGDRVGWPTLPPEQMPSAEKYFATHSREQVLARIENGADGLLKGSQRSHGYLPFVELALIAGALALVTSRATRRKLLRRWPLPLFVLGYFAGYLLFCTWFFSIQSGVRFVVALVPPLVFVGAWLSDSSRRLNFRRYIGFFALVALAWLALDLPELLSTVVVKARNAGW